MTEKNLKSLFDGEINLLEYKIGECRQNGKVEIAELFERVSSILGSAILNYDKVGKEDLQDLTSLIKECNKLIDSGFTIQTREVTEILEKLRLRFEEQKFLLGKASEENYSKKAA